MPVESGLIAAIRAGLAERSDPVRAPKMQAYMKSAMPYRGVPLGPIRDLCQAALASFPLTAFADWRDTALALFREAAYREERYAALELVAHRRYRGFRTQAALPLYEELIVTGAWWDLVDGVATSQLGDLVRSDHDQMAALLLAWAGCADRWKRRSAVIAQVKLRSDTDLDLLYACIEPNLGDRDFFIRKAIGWALRAHAWTDPEEVRRYVIATQERLSGLSRREALKNLK